MLLLQMCMQLQYYIIYHGCQNAVQCNYSSRHSDQELYMKCMLRYKLAIPKEFPILSG